MAQTVSIKLFGFPDARKLVFAQKKILRAVSNDLLGTVLFNAQNIVLHHLNMQDLAWTPLAVYTVQKKDSSLILLDTFLYRDSIRAWKTKSAGYVGVNNTVAYPSGIKICEVAIDNEFGTQKIPARPLWQPSANDVRAWRSSLSDDFLRAMIRKNMP